MNIVIVAEVGLVLASVAGLIVCWRQLLSTVPNPRDRRMLALGISSVIGLLPVIFHILEPVNGASSSIELRVYGTGLTVLLSLVGCPSAIALYFPNQKDPTSSSFVSAQWVQLRELFLPDWPAWELQRSLLKWCRFGLVIPAKKETQNQDSTTSGPGTTAQAWADSPALIRPDWHTRT